MTDRSLVRIALFAAVIAVLGFLPPIPIPFLGGTPITAQSLGIMLAGVMLGPWRGAAAVVLFLMVVAIGAPLLAGGRGGLAVFQSPWAGFLYGWPLAAFVAGWAMQVTRSWRVIPAAFTASVLGGIILLYLVAVPYLAAMTDKPLWDTFLLCAVFLPGDIIKAGVVALVADTVSRGLPSALQSRS
ncbi:biotin transporter BioY [Roseibium limicola]|uniref:Biotin transporter n=1 Tax=Roseibium limicola TaxID=2816037 RepID=A0A939J6V5_9HYPH|nr:biotin transporter BioY [Roseibium limicola]MBO0347270.1 biotin transporter BioY [Roseibium limicola]